MRFLLTSALILASGAAYASSITPVTNHGGNGSVVAKRCDACPPLQPKEVATGYKVPVLEQGSQKTEIVDINGEKKVLRTEAWWGGSPVVYVSKAQDWAIGHPPMQAGTAGDGVDHHALVGAVEAGAGPAEPEQDPAELNVATMQLRLD